MKDPKITILARVASGDQNYLRDIAYIVQHGDINQISKESELRQLRSCWDDLSISSLGNGKLVIRNGTKILIPKGFRQELVNELHRTHLSAEGMRDLVRGKFFWPGVPEREIFRM